MKWTFLTGVLTIYARMNTDNCVINISNEFT